MNILIHPFMQSANADIMTLSMSFCSMELIPMKALSYDGRKGVVYLLVQPQ